jgi:hypothetical protein
MTTLPTVSAAAIERAACVLQITDFETGARTKWVPSKAQITAWQRSEAEQRLFIGKPRRAYISTAFDLEDALWTLTCDGYGHRVRTGVMLDVEDKVTERMWQMSDFLTQLGAKHHATDYYIQFPNKSEIVGLTAGGKRAAASTGFQRMRYSEFSYYGDPQAMTATSASVGKQGHEVIETTVDVGAANGPQARRYWRDDTNAFEKLFIPFEWLDAYRADPSDISDGQWAMAQGEGFTDRSAAAFWLGHLLPNKCGGDLVQLMHEFPQLEHHMFQVSSGRWIKTTPAVAVPVETFSILGIRGEDWPVLVYRKPRDCGRCFIGVDTAQGKGQDRCVAIVIDEVDWRVVALVVSDRMFFDDLIRCVLELQQRYTKGNEVPLAVIEEQGIGDASVVTADRMGVVYDVHTPTDDTKYRGLLMAKMAVESGLLVGPEELGIECDELHRDPVTGKFKGRKDILMAYGFCALRMEQAPWLKPKPVLLPERTIDGARIIRALQRQERGRNFGWGGR